MTIAQFNRSGRMVIIDGKMIPWNTETNEPSGNTEPKSSGARLFDNWRIADLANGGTGIPQPYEAPAPVSPLRVSRRRFMMQLSIQGILQNVLAYVDQQSELVKIAFEESATFDRSDEMLIAGFTAMNFSTEEIDQFYLAASTL